MASVATSRLKTMVVRSPETILWPTRTETRAPVATDVVEEDGQMHKAASTNPEGQQTNDETYYIVHEIKK